MRTVALTTAKGGINRLRIKGGPSPDVLYDCVNGYVNQDGEIVSRPGSEQEIVLPGGTKGLCAFNGKLYVFSATSGLTTGNAKYVVEVIKDPVTPASAITAIHFAKPYLGAIYVVAEFASGSTYHYWLQSTNTWTPKKAVTVGEMVSPTVANGFVYRAHRLGASNPLWAAGVARSVGNLIEPTVANGVGYRVDSVSGPNPRSAAVEPVWPEVDGVGQPGVLVVEYADADNTQVTTPPVTPTPPTGGSGTPPRYYRDRYDRLITP